MSWASNHIDRLRRGETVRFRPRGSSMSGRIEDGQLVTVAPVDSPSQLQVGDIVLAVVGGGTYLHLVKAIGPDGRFQIGNNRGHVNGWTSARNIYGRLVSVEA